MGLEYVVEDVSSGLSVDIGVPTHRMAIEVASPHRWACLTLRRPPHTQLGLRCVYHWLVAPALFGMRRARVGCKSAVLHELPYCMRIVMTTVQLYSDAHCFRHLGGSPGAAGSPGHKLPGAYM